MSEGFYVCVYCRDGDAHPAGVACSERTNADRYELRIGYLVEALEAALRWVDAAGGAEAMQGPEDARAVLERERAFRR